ncbi:MAG TPA: amino acid permease [Myxococcaceae bacterium]|nr:amino acid permease [Myxococcaceae bacterium]
MLSTLFRTKSLEQLRASPEDAEVPRLKRHLTAFDLTMFGIGAIIGAGIFSTIGTAAAGNAADGRLAAGPALMVSFIVTAIACGFTALAYAELASMIPISGSAYTYAYATLGELAAWIIGWDLLLEYAVSNVAVAISWGDYARSFCANVFGLEIPRWLAMDPTTALSLAGGAGHMPLSQKLEVLAQAKAGLADGAATFTHWEVLRNAPTLGGFPVTINLLAMVITVLITWLCYIGIRESARANAVMVVVKVVILLGVVALGARYVQGGNWEPFSPNGWRGIQAGAAIIFFAFIGFDAVSTTAEECRDPGRDLPKGILWSLGICTVVYVLVTAVVTGMVKYTELAGKADPLAYVFERYNLNWLAGIVAFGAVIATTAALLVFQVGQPRIFMAMSRDGLLGRWFSKVHPRYGTPSNATIFTGFLVAVPAGLLNIDIVVELTNIGTLFAFAIVCVGVMVLRRRHPDAERRFRMPAAWLMAPLGILSCGWLAWGLPWATWLRFFAWLALGLLVYLFYGFRRSRLQTAGPGAA